MASWSTIGCWCSYSRSWLFCLNFVLYFKGLLDRRFSTYFFRWPIQNASRRSLCFLASSWPSWWEKTRLIWLMINLMKRWHPQLRRRFMKHFNQMCTKLFYQWFSLLFISQILSPKLINWYILIMHQNFWQFQPIKFRMNLFKKLIILYLLLIITLFQTYSILIFHFIIFILHNTFYLISFLLKLFCRFRCYVLKNFCLLLTDFLLINLISPCESH